MYIDLSVPINAQMPVYPGDPKTKVEPAGIMQRDGYSDHYVSLGTHAGTHIDAPMHMLTEGKHLGDVPIEQFIGRGRLVKVASAFDIAALEQADIQEGDIVLFATGMGEHYYEPVYFETYPAMSEEIARYLVERKVKMVGVDAGSVDNADGFPIHKVLLAGNVLIIENLANLNQLEGKAFKVYALPIRLEVDGAPARVIAEVEG